MSDPAVVDPRGDELETRNAAYYLESIDRRNLLISRWRLARAKVRTCPPLEREHWRAEVDRLDKELDEVPRDS